MAGEARVTSELVLVEMEGSGAEVTSMLTLVELGALGVYATEMLVLVEMELAALDSYAVGDGHDLPASFLTQLDPQPHCKGVRITRRDPSQNQEAHQDDALYIIYEYDVLETEEGYQAILDQLGVLERKENDITCTAQDGNQEWQRWNGTVVQPRMGKDVSYELWPNKIAILIKDVSLL